MTAQLVGLILLATIIGGLLLAFGLAMFNKGADKSALAAAEDATKRAEAGKAAMAETIGRVEDATLSITDRDSALRSLRARHPKP